MQTMSKEEFLEILSHQQLSGLTIKDFCVNEVYTLSIFYYWKSKFGLSRAYHSNKPSSSLEEFTPVNLPCSSGSNTNYDTITLGSEEIRIEFPSEITARFSGIAESHVAMQLLTQICSHPVWSEWYHALLPLLWQDRYAQSIYLSVFLKQESKVNYWFTLINIRLSKKHTLKVVL